MAFVQRVHVPHVVPGTAHIAHDLLRLGDRHPWIVLPLDDEERRGDLLGLLGGTDALQELAHLGVAFIAIKDESESDSGNIYLGDPRYGTLQKMQAYMYAENDFIDMNLDERGSKEVEIFGNMTAGNHVAIERHYEKSNGEVEHSKLTVNFDDRLSTGSIELPGLPQTEGRTLGVRVAYWREVDEN